MKNLVKTSTFLMSIVALLSPSVFMEISRANSAVADQFSLFTLGISNFLPFFMPIFAALLYAPVVMQEVGTGGAWGPIMARRGRSPYVVRHAVRAACAGFIVFAGSVALVAVLSYGIHPHLIPVDFFNPFGDDLEPVAERLTFSQLYAVSPVLYFAFQSIWVGIGGAALSTLAAVGAMFFENRFVALLWLPVVVLLSEFVAGALRVDHFSLIRSFIPTGVTQQDPLIPVVVGLVAFLIAGVVAAYAAFSAKLPKALC